MSVNLPWPQSRGESSCALGKDLGCSHLTICVSGGRRTFLRACNDMVAATYLEVRFQLNVCQSAVAAIPWRIFLCIRERPGMFTSHYMCVRWATNVSEGVQ